MLIEIADRFGPEDQSRRGWFRWSLKLLAVMLVLAAAVVWLFFANPLPFIVLAVVLVVPVLFGFLADLVS
ncbi:hypothetical protein [Skermania piniformis]|uniref:AI-2E family transporter n=1 Tax=Skermania pinensis TaxID=39122 RepID=A0ABX8SAM7_9ACTN|nr:hypothetical protein [Skermania piniformis]QXQ14919.1 hypothetical protein KV203_05965 [Skermania piniformis]